MPIDSTDEYRLTKERARARLDHALTGNAEVLRRINENHSGWALNLYREAGEASGSFRASHRSSPGGSLVLNPDELTQEQIRSAKERSREEAGRRARRQICRYCAHNRLNRLGTLTFATGCHDRYHLRLLLADFFKQLRKEIGRDLPYVWVPEWHSTDHGLHAHFAVGRYIKKTVIEAAWPDGFVHIKLLGDLPHGSLDLDQSRVAAGHLSKYVSKGFFDDRHIDGLHRYDIAQGFTPKPTKLFAPKLEDVLRVAVDRMGSPFNYIWHSNDNPDWARPAAVHLSW